MMSENRPPLTVITVVYNAAENIAGCIESVLAQRVQGLEYIVIDGGSTDRTLDIIKRYGEKVSCLVSEPDRGLYDAMNKGLKLATGRFIHFLNSDDRYSSSQVLASLIPKLDAAAVCYGQMQYIDNGAPTKLLGAPFEWSRELRASSVPQPTTFVSPELYQQVGEFDTSLKIAADYDMFLRLAKRFPVKYIAEPVTRMYSGGLSYARPDLTFSEAMEVSRRHGLNATEARLIYWARLLKWNVRGMLRAASLMNARSRRLL